MFVGCFGAGTAVESAAPPFFRDSEWNRAGNTALHDAARERHTETVKTILDDLTPDQQLQLLAVKNKEGKTASQEAAEYYRSADIMRILENYQKDADYRVNFRKLAKFS